jgi:hypothetical protein
MSEMIPATMVNHVALDIAAPPDLVWQAILDDYVEAKKFRALGVIRPLDDPGALFGGYSLRIEHEGVVDERIVRITERDDEARRLSAVADYLSVPGGMRVYATYCAQAADDGARFTIDCHTQLHVAAPPDRLAATIAEMTAGADAHLVAYLEGIRARLEEPA